MTDPNSAESGETELTLEEIEKAADLKRYFRSSLRVIFCLLPIWFFVSYGCGILLRDWLDAHAPKVGNASFGFWMAQQGSIICFVILLIVYATWMNRLDRKHNFSEDK